MTQLGVWATRRARFAFIRRDVRGVEAPLASATKDGVFLRTDLDFAVWNPDSDISNYKLVEPHDFVIGLRSFQHGISHSAVKGIVSPAYTVLRAVPELEPRYYKHYFRSSLLISQLANITQGIRQGQAIDIEAFQNLDVPTPPFEEQQRIADFLDAETARIGHIERRISSLFSLLGERQSATLSACFDGHSLAGRDSLVVPLRRVVKTWIDYRGATPEKTSSGIPLVTAKNIRDGKVDLDASREYISANSYDSWMRRGLPRPGDVLLTTEAPLGQVAMVKDSNVALAQRVILLRADQSAISPNWLYWYLRSPQAQGELELRATGSTALGIKADRLRGVPIPILGTDEMSRRVQELEERVKQVEQLKRPLLRQLDLLIERRTALITAAVTGQIDVSTASGRGIED